MDDNALRNAERLRNTVVALRHGQSLANVAGVICSDPAIACTSYGLSPIGKDQAAVAGQQIVDLYNQGIQDKETTDPNRRRFRGLVIVSSDLLRAKETAEALLGSVTNHNLRVQSSQANVGETVNVDSHDHRNLSVIPVYQGKVLFDVRLRERRFGEWDGQADSNYSTVWEQDAIDSSHNQWNVESVQSVRKRATNLVMEWEARLNQHPHGSDTDLMDGGGDDGHLVVLVAHGDVLQILQTAFAKIDGTMHRTIPHLETATPRILELSSNVARACQTVTPSL